MNGPRRPFLSGDLGDGDEQEDDAGEDPEGDQDLTHHTTIHGKWGARRGAGEIVRRGRVGPPHPQCPAAPVKIG